MDAKEGALSADRSEAIRHFVADPSPRALILAASLVVLIFGGLALGFWFGGRQAISLNVCTRQGNDALAADDSSGALGHFNRALWLDPDNAAAYFGRAQVYEAQNRPALALADYESFLRLHPSDDKQPTFARERIKALGETVP